jgi:hypothetical protein
MFPSCDRSETLLGPIQGLSTRLVSMGSIQQVPWKNCSQKSTSFLQAAAEDRREVNCVPVGRKNEK